MSSRSFFVERSRPFVERGVLLAQAVVLFDLTLTTYPAVPSFLLSSLFSLLSSLFSLLSSLFSLSPNLSLLLLQDPSKTSEHALGLMTTQERDTWALTRSNLVQGSPNNKAALDIVDSALFVLVLDDFAPKDINEAASNCLHGTYNLVQPENDPEAPGYQAGTCLNRWYDKLQLIVCADGSAGVNFEHSAIDGHTALRFVSDIFADTVVQFAQSITSTIYAAGHIPPLLDATVRKSGEGFDSRPKRLDFVFPTSTLTDIYYAETLLGDQLLQVRGGGKNGEERRGEERRGEERRGEERREEEEIWDLCLNFLFSVGDLLGTSCFLRFPPPPFSPFTPPRFRSRSFAPRSLLLRLFSFFSLSLLTSVFLSFRARSFPICFPFPTTLHIFLRTTG